MTWIQIDDGILDNPKIAGVGPIGFALHIAAIAYCSRNLTDGFVPFGKGRTLLASRWLESDADGAERVWSLGLTTDDTGDTQVGAEVIESTISALVDAQLWESVAGGYHVHDYEKHQRTSEQIAEHRAEHHDARVRAGQRSAETRRAKYGTAIPVKASNTPNTTEQTRTASEQTSEQSAEQEAEQSPNDRRTRVQRTELTPLSPNGDIPPLLVVVSPSTAASKGNGTKHRPSGKGKPSPEVLAAFTDAWNAACAPLPRLLKPPESHDGQRLVMQAWRAADGGVALLDKAIRLFALDGWNREHGYGFETFCRHPDTWLGKAASPPVLASAASSWD